MARYLVVAHQTANSSELHGHVANLVKQEPDAEFTLLAPATQIQHLLTSEMGESHDVALRRAEEAATRMRADGANVTRVAAGCDSATAAIKDELRDHPGMYDAIVISTFPAGLSRWLRTDVVSATRRHSHLPVTHVTAQKVEAEEPARV